MTVKWHPNRYLSQVERASRRGLRNAGLFLVREVKASFPGIGITGATRQQREASRSAPGEIPHVQTGSLKRSIAREQIAGEERVGTNLKYGRYLELGTRDIEPRPFLRPALMKNRKKILDIIRKELR